MFIDCEGFKYYIYAKSYSLYCQYSHVFVADEGESDIESSDDDYSYIHLSDLDLASVKSREEEDKSEYYSLSEQLILDPCEVRWAVNVSINSSFLLVKDNSRGSRCNEVLLIVFIII